MFVYYNGSPDRLSVPFSQPILEKLHVLESGNVFRRPCHTADSQHCSLGEIAALARSIVDPSVCFFAVCPSALQLSVLDSSVQGGDAVWAGVRVYNGKIFMFERCEARVIRSRQISSEARSEETQHLTLVLADVCLALLSWAGCGQRAQRSVEHHGLDSSLAEGRIHFFCSRHEGCTSYLEETCGFVRCHL